MFGLISSFVGKEARLDAGSLGMVDCSTSAFFFVCVCFVGSHLSVHAVTIQRSNLDQSCRDV